MNKNTKIAEELIKVAKSLVSEKRFSVDNKEDLMFYQRKIQQIINDLESNDIEYLSEQEFRISTRLSAYFYDKIKSFLLDVKTFVTNAKNCIDYLSYHDIISNSDLLKYTIDNINKEKERIIKEGKEIVNEMNDFI